MFILKIQLRRRFLVTNWNEMFYVHHVGVVIERNFVYLIIHSYILAQTSSRFYIYILEEKVD